MRTTKTTPTIMVAEDDVAFREVLVLALEANGFSTVAVDNAKDALEMLKSTDVSLLLLDLGLGEESGFDLLKSFRTLSRGERLPVILLTGRADRDTVMQIAQMSVQGYVLKRQLSRHDLMSRISQQLKRGGLTPRAPHAAAISSIADAPHGSSRSELQRSKRSVASLPNATTSVQSDAASADATADAAPVDAAPAELLRSLKPILTHEQTLAQVDKCAEMKAMSPTVMQLMSMTADPECSLEQLARVIRRDQVMTLKVLKLANSVVYKRGDSVDSVQKALSRIGVAQIRQAVLNISVIENFQLRGFSEHFTSELFWEHSIATGLVAAAITRFRHGDESEIDRAFTMGLLHDVARMVFAEQLGDMYKRVLDTASRLQLPLEHVESRMLLLNHAELMDRVLHAWKFPQRLVEPIAMHHLSAGNIRNLAPQIIEEASTIALADRLAHALLLGSSGNESHYATLEFVQILDLTSDAIKFIEEQIPEQTTEMKSAMLQSGAAGPSLDYRDTVLKQFRCPIRPLYVGSNADLDGYRILCERLRPSVGDRHPNIAIMHLASVSERESLFTALREREVEGGIDKLPLILVTPFVNVALEARLLNGRMHKVIPSPFALTRLADAANSLIPPEAE